jgi:COMPASS component SPP1
MDSDIDTDRNESAESTVEENSPERQRRQPLLKRKRSQANDTASINSPTKMKKGNVASELIHHKLGKLPNRSTFTPYDSNSEEVFCICRKPDTGELMVACDGCDEWYHFKCVNIDKRFQSLVLSYYCPYCELEGKGSTLWKRKCRLTGCFNGIAGNESKYCTKEHGLLFLKGAMSKGLGTAIDNDDDTVLSKGNVVQFINTVPNFKTFRSLGDKLPEPSVDFSSDPKVLKIKEVLETLKSSRNEFIQRKKLLIITRENIKKINDLLTTEPAEPSEPEAPKAKSSKRSKVKKIEICGYDPLFRKSKLEDSELNEGNLQSNDAELLKSKFIQLRDDEEPIDDETVSVCLLEKRKCSKHNGWQSIINDEIDTSIDNIDRDIAFNEEKIQKTIRSSTIAHFENNGTSIPV